ncbi:MAG: hypothetical protein JNK74_16800 [Candidatus Hydrogenedentes bacterium]|nr:hypothetical protein [Candidatus Hydrogenedentota bacterium]
MLPPSLWNRLSCGFCACILALAARAQQPLPVTIAPDGANDLTIATVGEGMVEINTTGPDPYLFTQPLPEGTTVAPNSILEFEYFSLTGTTDLQVFIVPPGREENSVKGPGLVPSQGWSSCRIDIWPARVRASQPYNQLRIDFGREAGRSIQIRNMVLRAQTPEERANESTARNGRSDSQGNVEAEPPLSGAEAADARLNAYLGQDIHSGIDISVGESTIAIRGALGRSDGDNPNAAHWLVEIPIEADYGDTSSLNKLEQITAGWDEEFEINAPRYAEDGRDRLYSRWAILQEPSEYDPLMTFGTYATQVTPRPGLTEAKPRNRKGLGGFSPGRPVEDIEALGVSAVTINIMLDSYMRTEPGEGRTPYPYCGRTWYTDDAAVANLDDHMLSAAKYNLIVSAIILLNQGKDAPEGEFRRIVAHPDADPAGIFVMPNFTSAEGVAAYAAAMNFLAERYSKPDGQYGRIHHWILHNEVNSGWVWTNMGDKPPLTYMDAYHKSMRMAQLIAWQYDPYAKVYISLEHHWNSVYAEHCYRGKELLALLLEFSRAEGDFPWGIAYHPYPEDLRDPRAWEDETAWFSFDTPRITFKNMEVIDAWVKNPETWYRGETRRDLQFTEQGPNSPDYSEKSLTDQAACMAYLWKKMEPLDSVSMFHFHNWVDNRHEGGLRIGLRRYPDDEEDPHGRKPVWYVFQALSTPDEDRAIEFAKPVIGINDWSEVNYRGTIPEVAPATP